MAMLVYQKGPKIIPSKLMKWWDWETTYTLIFLGGYIGPFSANCVAFFSPTGEAPQTRLSSAPELKLD